MTKVKEHIVTQSEMTSGKTMKSIYFNKRRKTSTGKKSKYKSGIFYSAKMQKGILFKSAYEYQFYKSLELNPEVDAYVAEPFCVTYISSKGEKKNYVPDVIALYKDGVMDLFEVKPISMLANADVQAKANAARIFLQRNFKEYKIKFKFITESELFSSDEEYQRTLKEIDILNERLNK